MRDPARKPAGNPAGRALLAVALVLLAPVAQVSVVNGLGLPGGGPDLVLIGVVTLGMVLRPMAATVVGFAAGLAADIAPPADHSIGRHALVLCLIGYLCALVPADSSAGQRTAAALGGTLGGALLDAALAGVLGDESWTSVLGGLPGSLAWTVAGGTLVAVALVSLLPRRRRFGGPASRAAARGHYTGGHHA
ncbi:rod shape-determining protein MreD [Planotetraspora sp. A-T 1434]|uniref:rod shape-determining protein MreD n=1 Tax=Planotetraspora sp. A-T 1434 TaxID=2979219 RepID=UPI0021BEF6B1|nr:rod shape-determining protein MreD [Planotetraspora sp. A-T 1434]MCT9928991.1 rod shape-determining protein MreD [Planotetraspora sp. A-T 1434]